MTELTGFFDALVTGGLQWRAPFWLWGVFAPFALMMLTRLRVRKNKQGYADAHLWPWVQVQHESAKFKVNRPVKVQEGGVSRFFSVTLRLLMHFNRLITPLRLLAVAWISLMIAVAGPRSLQPTEVELTRGGVDVLVVMDLSHSMTATDVFPNRFLQAKTLVESLKNSLQVDDRLALMGFAGQPHTVSPLSFDRGLFQHNLDLIEPDMMPTQGSWLELALIAGTNHLVKTGGKAKVMLVFTNGNPIFLQAPPLPKNAAELPFANDLRFSQTGVKTLIVGMGKLGPSTLPDETHKSGNLHAGGILVQSRLEELSLKKWAQNLQGTYLRGADNGEFMQRLLQAVTLPAGERMQTQDNQNWQDFAQPFMVLGVAGLFLAFFPVAFSAKRFTSADITGSKGKVSSPSVLGGLLIFMAMAVSILVLLPFNAANANTVSGSKSGSNVALEQQAYDAYQNQDYETATALFDQLNDYAGWMGAGSAAYKKQDLESAVLYFRQAALSAQKDNLRAKALFNLGNSYYLANLLPQAIESYQQALLYQTPYLHAQHNLTLATDRLKLELANQKQGKDDEGEEGEAEKGRGDDGAFYGGKKTNASSEDPGFGADGNAQGGNRSGEGVILPLEGDPIDYELQGGVNAQLNSDARANAATANAILNRAKQLKRAQAFQQQLNQIEDQQKVLLKRLFEREEGFQAPQDKPHPVPGVQPW